MSSRPRILFLFNHDAAHQAAHIAGIAGQMALDYPGVTVICATGSPAIATIARRSMSPEAGTAVRWHDLSLPALLDRLLAPLNRLFPARRLARLRTNDALFSSVEMIVSTERTCLSVRRRLRRRNGTSAPRFAYVPHGSGDRNVSIHPSLEQFDLFLLSGQKVVDQMVDNGICGAEACRIIGYPKFDTVDRDAKPRYFANDRPVFLYNPHFDPHLSSWYDEGVAILNWFAERADDYNLIFAPHVMLFRKRLHISPEYRIARLRPDIPAAIRDAPNILVDIDSPRLFDMSYTLGADVYIGDMSSQVYEFLVRPRACFFIDVHSEPTDADGPPYEFWRNGPVVRGAEELFPLIEGWRDVAAHYRPEQERLTAYTIGDDPRRTASQRGAAALAEALGIRG